MKVTVCLIEKSLIALPCGITRLRIRAARDFGPQPDAAHNHTQHHSRLRLSLTVIIKRAKWQWTDFRNWNIDIHASEPYRSTLLECDRFAH